MVNDLSGQKVLVVGAGGGIGAATARAFAEAGASVTAAGRPGARLDAIAAEIGATAAALDMLDDGAVEAFFAGRPAFDHVVVAAAATRSGTVSALPIDDARASVDSKFWGAYLIARAARIADGGSLTFVSGFLSRRPSASAVLQGAINAALEALARGLALERAPVRVNTVSPGLIDTPAVARHGGRGSCRIVPRRGRTPARAPGRPAGEHRGRHPVRRRQSLRHRVHRHGGRRRHDRLIAAMERASEISEPRTRLS